MTKTWSHRTRAAIVLTLALAPAVVLGPDRDLLHAVQRGIHPRSRLLTMSVTGGAPTFLRKAEFEDYVDAILALGIRDLHVFVPVRMRCSSCGPNGAPDEIDTAPAVGVYDFSRYFERLDHAINQKGMRVVLSFTLNGRLNSEPVVWAAVNTLPSFVRVDDVMMVRDATGTDIVFATPPADWELKVVRFEKPSVRAFFLDYVTAVVTQFRARYGDSILYYGFTFNTTAENEYALHATSSFPDTSPDAAAAFRDWLASRYPTPDAVSTAWGRRPAFTTFDEIQILDGRPPPPVGAAPRAYLDFMAYREAALGSFMGEIRKRVHRAQGRVLAQYGSVFDWLSARRGTFGFGRQIEGYDLVLVDDAPGYPHAYSMDYVRTNSPGVPFGNEVDSACRLGCASGDFALCCDIASFPTNIHASFGMSRMDTQVNQTYDAGAACLDITNWDFYYQSAFPLFAASLANAMTLAQEKRTKPATLAIQNLSLRELYAHHEDPSYIHQLVVTHAAFGEPVAVTVIYDLDP
jgi:hypothetical protein